MIVRRRARGRAHRGVPRRARRGWGRALAGKGTGSRHESQRRSQIILPPRGVEGCGSFAQPGDDGMAKQDNLDPQTRDLVRFAAAIAQGYEPELRERVGPLRASQVPTAWVEELLLQPVLMVGYPRALIAFTVW